MGPHWNPLPSRRIRSSEEHAADNAVKTTYRKTEPVIKWPHHPDAKCGKCSDERLGDDFLLILATTPWFW